MVTDNKAGKITGRSPFVFGGVNFIPVIGGLSFIPVIGVPFGLIAIVWGRIKYNKGGKSLIVLGVGGILFNVMLYGFFYWVVVVRGF